MIEKLEKIITSSNEYKMLASELEKGSLAKTIMLLSKDSEYSFEFARLLSTLILNGGLKEGQLERNENYVKVLASSHPDVKVYPTKDKLLVADSEDIVSESSIRPIFAERKVFIIKNIEQSMEAAQNKLLKTLEEPQNNVYFILTSSNANLVLPTIRSRCSKIELGKLSQKDIELCIDDCENIELVSQLCEGYVGRAKRLSQMDNLGEMFRAVLNLVTKLKASKELLIYSKELSNFYSEQDNIFKFLSLIYEDLLLIKGGKEGRLSSFKSELEAVSQEYTIKAIVEIEKLINKAVREVGYNCNAMVVIENLLLSILEVKYLCR